MTLLLFLKTYVSLTQTTLTSVLSLKGEEEHLPSRSAMTTQFHHPEAIATCAWLEDHLKDRNLRLFECTTYLEPPAEGVDAAYSIRNAKVEFDVDHIPGACLIDLQADLCDASSPAHLRFMMPAPELLGAAFASFGVSDDSRVVLYSRGSAMWATCVWWMLRAIGFDNAAVLDGWWDKWMLDGRPTSRDPGEYPRGQLTVRARPEVFVGKDEIAAAMGDPAACTINALTAELHRGESGRYGRRGRIPGSVNLPYASLVDANDQTFLAADAVAASLQNVGAEADKRCLVYCGGGIAASLDAFLMYQLGYEDVAIYDASMSEWARDESLPIETG